MKKLFKNLSEKEIEQYAVNVAYPAITPFTIKKGNKVDSNISGGHFPLPILGKMFNSVDKILSNKTVKEAYNLLINDLGLQWVHKLNKEFGLTKFYMLCVDTANVSKEYIKALILDTCRNIFDMEDIEVVPVYLHELGDTLKMINRDKFDLVIANPPYGYKNKLCKDINKEILYIANEAVVLCPLDGFIPVENYLTSLTEVAADSFDDALPPNLYIATYNEKSFDKNISISEYISREYPDIKVFKEANKKLSQDLFLGSLHSLKQLQPADSLLFMIQCWATNGVSVGDKAKDVRHNIYKEPIDWKYADTADKYIKFNCDASFNNFTYWWYSNKKSGLTNLILFWLNKLGTNSIESFKDFLPRIDWSRTDVEYTDEYVLSQMGLKWNENKDGVEKL